MLAPYDVPAHVKQMAVFMLLYLTGKIHELPGAQGVPTYLIYVEDVCGRYLWLDLQYSNTFQSHTCKVPLFSTIHKANESRHTKLLMNHILNAKHSQCHVGTRANFGIAFHPLKISMPAVAPVRSTVLPLRSKGLYNELGAHDMRLSKSFQNCWTCRPNVWLVLTNVSELKCGAVCNVFSLVLVLLYFAAPANWCQSEPEIYLSIGLEQVLSLLEYSRFVHLAW